MRRNFSLFTRYSLEFTRCLLLVANSLIARYSLPNSFVARYSLLMDWLLITRCKFACWSLLVANSLVELFAKANQKKKRKKRKEETMKAVPSQHVIQKPAVKGRLLMLNTAICKWVKADFHQAESPAFLPRNTYEHAH